MRGEGIRLDVGCGGNKKESFIGVDKLEAPGVDYLVDFENEKLPFPDKSVSEIYSYHCLEHLRDPTHIFSEFGRVAMDGAIIEIWTPYAFSSPAYIPDHKFFFTEEIYFHICCWYREFWFNILHAYWYITEMIYVCSEETLRGLAFQRVPVGFAVKHYNNICKDFGIYIEVSSTDVRKDFPVPMFATTGKGKEKIDISEWWRDHS